MRLWSRDELVLRETRRSPLLVEQLTRLCDFSTTKKASERTCQYERAGLVKSCPFFQTGMQGRAPKVIHQGARPSPFSLRHTLLIAEVRVQASLSFPDAQFFYGHELSVPSIRPDAALIVQRGEKAALVFFEVDCGTERLTSPSSYSLLGKLRSYAAYFDSGQYANHFSFAGVMRGFRVGLVLTSALRLANVQRLLAAEGLDFVLVTTVEDLTHGLQAPVWQSHDARRVDVFGRTHG